MGEVILGYWKIRGLAAAPRLLAAYCGLELKQEFYTSRDVWGPKKEALREEGMAFPNLPYMIVKDETGKTTLRLTQSVAILGYIAEKYDMLGSTPEERAIAEMVLEEGRDFARGFTVLCYGFNPEFNDENVAAFFEKLPSMLTPFEKFLEPGKWFAGSKLLMCDFFMWHALEQLVLFRPTCLDDFPKLKDFLVRFESEPKIKAHMESENFLHWPLNGAIAKWGGEGEDPAPKLVKTSA